MDDDPYNNAQVPALIFLGVVALLILLAVYGYWFGLWEDTGRLRW